MSSNALLVFLVANAFLVGVIGTIAWQHAWAHFRPNRHDAERNKQTTAVKLPGEVREQLLKNAEANYQKVLDAAANELQLDLSKTKVLLNKELTNIGADIIDDEMKRYRGSLDELQKLSDAAIAKTHEELEAHKGELQAALAEQQNAAVAAMNAEVEAEKAKIIAQIDTKLADAAVSFLVETLQHEVDLGAQLPYLTKMIEEHKDEFKKDAVGDETTK